MTDAARVADHLGPIPRAIERTSRYTADMDQAAFLANELVQDAVVRNIEILGEAANKVQREAPEFAARHGDVPWMVMYTMRNRVSHAYDKVDLEIVWNTIRNDLPALHARVQAVQASIPDSHAP